MHYAQRKPEHTAQLSDMQRAYAGAMTKAAPSLRRQRRHRNFAALVERAGGTTEMAALLRTQKSYVSAMANDKRGVGDEIAARVERALGLPPGWMDQEHQHPQTGYAQDQDLSLTPVILPPLLTWEVLASMTELPQKFALTLVDGAMSPALPKGTKAVFDATGAAEPGQVALVRVSGAYHVRQLRLQADGSVRAVPFSAAWPTFDKFDVVAVVVEVTTGIEAHLARFTN